MISQEEQRKYPRADVVFNLEFFTDKDVSLIPSKSRDISLGGISFKSDEKYVTDTGLTLTLNMAELPQPVTARGKVVRSWQDSEEFFTAIEFTEIDGADLMLILDYINVGPT